MIKEINDYLKELKLGSRLELIFKITGIKWMVKKIHPNCKCEQRKNYLNEIQIKRK